MRPVTALLFALALVSNAASARLPDAGGARVGSNRFDALRVVPGEVIVGWEEGAAAKPRAVELASAFDLDVVPSPGLEAIRASLLRARGSGDAARLAARLAAVPGVRYAEPNVVVYPASVPTDPLYGGVQGAETDLQRWAYGGVGANRVLNAEAAWDVTKGDPSVLVAVLDSGLDVDNPEYPNLWKNGGEVAGNGLDDDRNGFVDDVHGYDFHSRDADVRPDLGDGEDNDFNDAADDTAPHGPQVASILASAHDGAGMVGGAPDCSLMIVKIYGDDGGAPVATLAEAIKYAVDNGSDVMNLSLATPFGSSALRAAVKYATDRNAIVVAAAGNGTSRSRLYPASYFAVISVGGSDSGLSGPGQERNVNGRWPKSQYGPGAVDIVAPAVSLASSPVTVARAAAEPDRVVGETVYDLAEGTSIAVPHVSALAALAVSLDKAVYGRRTLGPTDVEALLARTAVDLPFDGRGDNDRGGANWDHNGRVDFEAALAKVPGAGPPAPVIESASYRHRELRVYGDGFSLESTIEVNGVTPSGQVRFTLAGGYVKLDGKRGALHLVKHADNRIVVVERGVRSAEFIFRF